MKISKREDWVVIVNFKTVQSLFLLWLALLPLTVTAQEHIGQVVGVSDGDMLRSWTTGNNKSKCG